ncbi:hypothetical protein [Phocaeicola coprophilus]|uniref:hypothetical protein n=1 Tax=Phocaeicola coprophilus TaxID=387090 RepID=UPI003AB35BC5
MMVYRGFACAEEALNVLMYHTVGGEYGALSIEEFYKLKYCSTVVYMVPRA